VYFMRTVPSDSMPNSTSKFDEMMINCLSKLINFKIDNNAYIQLTLNISNGGLGIRKVSNHHAAAFFSSVRSCLPLIREVTSLPGIRSTRLMNQSLNLMVPSTLPSITPAMKNQSAISSAIDKVLFARLLEAASEIDKARILSTSSPHAGDFLICPPIPQLGLKLSSTEWSVAVAYKLGVNFLPNPVKCKANGCSKSLDVQALHALRCGTEGDRLKRHNNLRNFFFKECQKALVSPVLEPTNILRNCGLRPADWGIPDFLPGKFMAYDVAVTDPTQDAFVKSGAITRGYAAETYALNSKIAKYADSLSKDNSVLLSPIIVETYGCWNSCASDFFQDLSSWLAARDPNSSGPLICARLYQKASVIIQRSNARMILSRIQSY